MANIGDTCVSIGNRDWFIGDSVSVEPSTVLPFETAQLQRGGSARISAGNSFTQDALDVLHFVWTVVNQPNGEQITYEGEDLDLLIDEIGEYEITLQAIGANGGCGSVSTLFLYVFSGDATQHAATALDTSWVWEMLPSAWSTYPSDLRLKSEIFWRGLTQIIGSDLTKAFAFDINKGIAGANQRRPARWINADLVHSLEDATLIIRPELLLDIDQVIDERKLRVVDPLVNAQFSANVSVIFVRDDTLKVNETSGMTPLTLDENGSFTVSLPNRDVLVQITSVDMIDARTGLYTISPPLQEPNAGDILDAVFTSPNPEESTRFGHLGTRGVAFREHRAAADILSINEGYVLAEDTELAQRSAISSKAFWESGVRPLDVISVNVEELVSSTSTNVLLKVVDVLTLEDGLDYVIFEPFAGTYADIASVIVQILIPDEPDAIREILSFIEKTILTRAYGFRLKSSSEFSITVSGKTRVLRVSLSTIRKRSAFTVDNHVEELSTLREFIEVQNVTSDGNFVLTEANRAINLGRQPITLLENRDFRVYREGRVLRGLSYTLGQNYILSPQGYLSSLVRRGYELVFDSGYGAGRYYVTEVRNDKIYVTPNPRLPFSDSSAEIVRASEDTLVEIEDESILPVINGVVRLWCESATVSDYEELESKYGIISDLTYERWKSLRTANSYLDIIRAFILISVSGHSVNALRDLVSMVLGLPYTPVKSIVRRIDREVRSDQGAVFDKVILEELDREGLSTGRFNAYYGVSRSDSNVVGNLGFIEEVTQGSVIDAGTVLVRGISLNDKLGDSPSKRHVFDVRVAAGSSPLNATALRYARESLDKLKPAYTDFRLFPEIHVRDTIEIESDVTFFMSKRLTDTPYGLHGPAEVLDDFIPGMGRVDTRPFIVLNTWFPSDGIFEQIGNDIKVVSVTGGFVTPIEEIIRTVYVKVGDELQEISVRSRGRYDRGDWLKQGDALIFKDRHNISPMRIDRIIDDKAIIVNAEDQIIGNLKDVSFLIIRYVDDLLLDEDNLPASLDESAMVIELGARASSVGRGDLVSFNTALDSERPIRHLTGTKAVLETRKYPPLSAEATSGGSSIRIRRSSLTPETRGSVFAKDTGADYPGNVRLVELEDNAEYLGARVGDYIGPYIVLAIFETRRFVAVRSEGEVEAQEYSVTNPRGILGDDALDLADGGVRSSVHIKIKMPRPARRSRITLNDRGSIENTGGVLDLVKVEQGDILVLEESRFNVGEGRGICRAINSSADQGGFFDTNAPVGSILSDTLNSVQLIRQSPIKPYINTVE